jgi:hypothetical protein
VRSLADLLARTVETRDGCLEWQGNISMQGYGRCWMDGRLELCHRAAYLLTRGELPEVVRHTCDNSACCNPQHLRAGTDGDNVRDMVARGRHYWAKRTHCKNGHEYSPENTKWRNNGRSEFRVCRACIREDSQQRRDRERRRHADGNAQALDAEGK